MKIFTWTYPKYFNFCLALCKSIRINNNDNEIIVDLIDFNKKELESAKNILNERIGGSLRFINTSSSNHLSKNENKDEFYRNHRVNVFLQLLKEDKRDLCTFGANGIVRTNLKYLEDLIKENHFIFLERPRDNLYSNSPKKIEGVYELADMIKINNLNNKIDEIIESHTGRCVLLGTHVIKNCQESISVIEGWQRELLNFKDSYRKKFCDMDFFVKSMILEYYKTNKKLNVYTAKNIPRELSPLCDTTFNNASLIWFAKGPSKFNNQKYINALTYILKQKGNKK